jgi:hypothetical protein
LKNVWVERIAEAAQTLHDQRRGFLAVKPRAIHPLVLRFLLDSGSIEHLGRIGELRHEGNSDVEAFSWADGRKHLYRLEPERLDEIRRWALMNAPPIVVRFRKGIGLRLEPKNWEAPPKPEWPWYPE